MALAVVWGFSVVADSAQFSALVCEPRPPDHVGTALTLQTCVGFLLTMVSIRLRAGRGRLVGWRWAFLLLVPGAFSGPGHERGCETRTRFAAARSPNGRQRNRACGSWRWRSARPPARPRRGTRAPAGDSGSPMTIGTPVSPPDSDRLVDRNAAEERHAELGGERLAAALAEDVALVPA